MKIKQSFLTSLLFTTALLVFTNVAPAAPVTGSANIGGNVTVTGSSIQFQPTFAGLGGNQTGSFAGLTGGTIQSLSGGPVVGSTNVPAFVSFTTGLAAPITFDLTYIAPGVGTLGGCSSAALGSSCTPAGSPFTLFQLSSNTVIASLQLNGVSYTGSAATGTTPTVAIFSTQTAISGTIPDIYATLVGGGAISGVTYSASFATTAVPEPASLALMGLGLMGAGLLARRRFSR